MKNLLDRCPVIIELPVVWGEMDAFGHVNNAVYFRYFESARIYYFDRLDYAEFMKRTGIGPILAATNCRFKIPLIYPDKISVGARISEIGDDRFTMRYSVVSHKHQKIAAEGDGTIVYYNYRENKKTMIPAEIKQQIEKLESSVGNKIST